MASADLVSTSAATATSVDLAEIDRQEAAAAAEVQELELRLQEARAFLRQWKRQWRTLVHDRVDRELLHSTTTSSMSVVAPPNDSDHGERAA